ncbi:MAG: hypothetical protein ACI8PT_002104 [Gammaproteobacteria bacterium]|jgi:hypothetical protein
MVITRQVVTRECELGHRLIEASVSTITNLRWMCAVVCCATLIAAHAASSVDIEVRTVDASGEALAFDQLSWWREDSAHTKATVRCPTRRCTTWALHGARAGEVATASNESSDIRIFFSATRAEETDASCWRLFVGDISIVREDEWPKTRTGRRAVVKLRCAGMVCK